jgi:hypothetical protein
MPPRLTGPPLTLFLARWIAVFLAVWAGLLFLSWRLAVFFDLSERVGAEAAKAIVFLAPLGLTMLFAKAVARRLRARSGT